MCSKTRLHFISSLIHLGIPKYELFAILSHSKFWFTSIQRENKCSSRSSIHTSASTATLHLHFQFRGQINFKPNLTGIKKCICHLPRVRRGHNFVRGIEGPSLPHEMSPPPNSHTSNFVQVSFLYVQVFHIIYLPIKSTPYKFLVIILLVLEKFKQ